MPDSITVFIHSSLHRHTKTETLEALLQFLYTPSQSKSIHFTIKKRNVTADARLVDRVKLGWIIQTFVADTYKTTKVHILANHQHQE